MESTNQPKEVKTAEHDLVKNAIEHIGKIAMATFHALDLKTHIEAMVVDADSKEEFVITINKVSNGQLFKGGEIVFTKKQRNDFANQEVQKVIDDVRELTETLKNDKYKTVSYDANKNFNDGVDHCISELTDLLSKHQTK